MFSAIPGDSSWDYLPALGNKNPQQAWILIVHSQSGISAEPANLTPGEGATFLWSVIHSPSSLVGLSLDAMFSVDAGSSATNSSDDCGKTSVTSVS